MNVTLNLTIDQVNALLNILNTPYNATTANLFYFINLIQDQVAPQVKEQEPEQTTEETKDEQ